MSDPQDERERFWKALQVNSDRITELEAIVSARNDMMRETITSAVRAAMPTAMLNDAQHDWVELSFQRWKDRAALHKKIIESTAIWAVPILILAGLAVLREFFISHGWKP